VVGCPCLRLGSGEARSCPLSGPSLGLIAPIRPLQLCADGGYQLRLGVLGVPLIMVPDTCSMRMFSAAAEAQTYCCCVVKLRFFSPYFECQDLFVGNRIIYPSVGYLS
jgi:hypothetical protein